MLFFIKLKSVTSAYLRLILQIVPRIKYHQANRLSSCLQNPTVEWKVCRRCGTNKPAADFYRNKTNGDGLYNNCKACFSHDAANRRERLPPLEERTAAAKECRRCKETKPAGEFYKNKHMSDGLYTHCKVNSHLLYQQLVLMSYAPRGVD